MEIQLQELIDQIKKDGVEAAESKAASIIEEAKSQAEKIISDAKHKAEEMLASAKNENQRFVQVSEDSIKQAGRNLLISFRDSVNRELKAVVEKEVSSVYSSDAMAEIILKLSEAWTNNPDCEDISVLLNSEDLKRLENTILASLKEKLMKNVTIKANDNFDGGFRIAVDNGKAYYDYSSEAVVQMLSAYLSPRVTSLMKEAEGV